MVGDQVHRRIDRRDRQGAALVQGRQTRLRQALAEDLAGQMMIALVAHWRRGRRREPGFQIFDQAGHQRK